MVIKWLMNHFQGGSSGGGRCGADTGMQEISSAVGAVAGYGVVGPMTWKQRVTKVHGNGAKD